MLEAYITNLGRYNEGHLDGEYLKLPATTEEVQALLKRIQVDGVRYEEIFITDYQTDISGLRSHLGENESVDELNYLAALVDDLGDWDREKFEAAVAYGEDVHSLKDLINLTQNLDCYEVYPNVEDVEDLGRYLIDELDWEQIPEHIEPYFDYGAYGRDFAINESGRFQNGGYTYRNDVDFTEHYTGRDDLPEEHKIFAYPEPEKSIQKALASHKQLDSEKEAEPMDSPKKMAEPPIAENEHVKELLSILQKHNSPSTKDLLSVLRQVGAMEKQLTAAVQELAAMRQELKTAQEQNHPVKTAMQKAVIAMQGQVLELRDKLKALKQNVIDSCKNAVAAFKESGISALNNIARFFKVRPALENMRNNLTINIRHNDKAIAKIEAISTEYHEAGRHIKNIGRAVLGKEALQESKPLGFIAKTITAPIRAFVLCFAFMKTNVEKAIGAVERLENRERKPPIMETVKKLNEQIAQAKKDAPAKERPRPVTHDGR